MRIVLLGPPGSGKGTIATRLSKKLQATYLSTGDIVRDEINSNSELGQRIKKFSEKGELVPDQIINDLVKEKISLDKGKHGFILDGYPRTVTQAEFLNKVAPIDLAIYLDVPDEIIVERLSTRLVCSKCGAIFNEKYLKPKIDGVCDRCSAPLYKREDDKPKVIRERLKVYRKSTMPLIDYYGSKYLLKRIESNEVSPPPQEVVKKILKVIEKP